MAIEAGTSTYYQAKRGIVQDGLVLHLDAGVKESYSGGNIWYNLANRSKNGTLTNGPLSTRSRIGGRSIEFDKTNDYINLNSVSSYSSNFYNNGVTYCVWYQPPSSMTYSYPQGLFVSQPHTGYWLSTCGGLSTYQYKVRVHAYNTTQSYRDVISSISINDGDYHYLVSTFDPTDQFLRLYIDGSLNATGSTAITSFVTTGSYMQTYLGGRSGGNQPTEGKISQAQLYTRALSASEVLQNYNATRHRFGL
jgi:hypothetical protein